MATPIDGAVYRLYIAESLGVTCCAEAFCHTHLKNILRYWYRYLQTDVPALYGKECHKEVHHDKVAGTSKHDKHMENFVGTEVFVSGIKERDF